MKTTATQIAPIPDKILDELKPVDNFLIGKASTHSTTPKSTVPPTTPPPTTITTINNTIQQNNTSTEMELPSKTPRPWSTIPPATTSTNQPANQQSVNSSSKVQIESKATSHYNFNKIFFLILIYICFYH